MRLYHLDIIRGYAVALMIIDHALHVVIWDRAADLWYLQLLRNTVTRLALPLFMGVAGWLIAIRGRPSAGRLLTIFWAGVAATLLSAFAHMPVPDILLLFCLVMPGVGAFARAPVAWLAAGFLQAVYVPVPWPAYQPGLVVGWLCLGMLAARGTVPRLPRLGSDGFAALGRFALTAYVLHLGALALIVALAR